MHDLRNPGVAVGVGESTTIMSKFEYADDAALVDADAATATARVTALAAGSITDAAMVISQAKNNIHIHRKTHDGGRAVCSTLTHASEAWALTAPVMRSVNGFNSRCLHITTGQDYRVTATAPKYDLVRAIRQRRLRYLGHILRMSESRVV